MRFFKKIIQPLCLVCLLFLPSIAAPKSCELMQKDAPALYGFRLGMPLKDFATAKQLLNAHQSALIAYEIVSSEYMDYITSLRGRFYDDKLYSLEIGFDKKYKKVDVKSYAKAISDDSTLPFESWNFEAVVAANQTAKINCSDFTVEIDSVQNKITVTDLLGSRKAIEANNRKASAPSEPGDD